jgi:hypothetical protein
MLKFGYSGVILSSSQFCYCPAASKTDTRYKWSKLTQKSSLPWSKSVKQANAIINLHYDQSMISEMNKPFIPFNGQV